MAERRKQPTTEAELQALVAPFLPEAIEILRELANDDSQSATIRKKAVRELEARGIPLTGSAEVRTPSKRRPS